jgi:hypothetical protein
MANGVYGSTQQNLQPPAPFLDGLLPSLSWKQYFLNLTNFSSSNVANTSTSGVTLPANPVGFINVTVNGKQFKVPYYNV